MQTIYEFDHDTGVPTGVTELSVDQELNADYQTAVVPPENKSVKFDKSTQTWVEFTPPTDPVTAQLAELIKSNSQQTALNAQLIKQVTALQTQTHTTQEAK